MINIIDYRIRIVLFTVLIFQLHICLVLSYDSVTFQLLISSPMCKLHSLVETSRIHLLFHQIDQKFHLTYETYQLYIYIHPHTILVYCIYTYLSHLHIQKKCHIHACVYVIVIVIASITTTYTGR